MERRARCRICNEVLNYSDPTTLGYHLLTKHPNYNPVYFTVTEDPNSPNQSVYHFENKETHSQKNKNTNRISFKNHKDDNYVCDEFTCPDVRAKSYKTRPQVPKKQSNDTVITNKESFHSAQITSTCDDDCPGWKRILSINKKSTSNIYLDKQQTKSQASTSNKSYRKTPTPIVNETKIPSNESLEYASTKSKTTNGSMSSQKSEKIVKVTGRDSTDDERYACKYQKTTVTSWEPGTGKILCSRCKKDEKKVIEDCEECCKGNKEEVYTKDAKNMDCNCDTLYMTTVTSWRTGSKQLICPLCKQKVTPLLRKQRNKLTKHSIAASFLLGCWPLCFLCPMRFKQQSKLYCPSCQKPIGSYDRSTGDMKLTPSPTNVNGT